MRSRLALVISVDRHWLAFNEVRHMYIPLSNRDSCPTMDCRQKKNEGSSKPEESTKDEQDIDNNKKKRMRVNLQEMDTNFKSF